MHPGSDVEAPAVAAYTITLLPAREAFACGRDETLLQAMARLGRKGIPAGCVNGGCGICKVEVVRGRVRTVGPMSRAHVSVEEEARGVVLACRAAPLDHVELQVIGRL